MRRDGPLDWVPWDRTLQPPAGLKDFQQAWFTNLLRASFFDQKEMQGYLPITSQLWLIAGAHRRDLWESHKSLVMAAFDVHRLEGGTEVMFFPPLVELIRKQRKRLREHLSIEEAFPQIHSLPQKGREPSLSPSQSGFDFDSNNQEQNLKTSNTRDTGYSHADFAARDLRLMKKAREKLDREAQPGDEREIFERICQASGITVARGLELERIQKQWPEGETAPKLNSVSTRCERHPEAGQTDWGECWGCYGAKYQSGCQPA